MEKNKITLQDIIKVRQLVDDINASYTFMEVWQGTFSNFYFEVYIDKLKMCWWRGDKQDHTHVASDISDLLWKVERLANSMNDQVWRVVMEAKSEG